MLGRGNISNPNPICVQKVFQFQFINRIGTSLQQEHESWALLLQVSWHPESGALMFTSLDLTIACPTSAQLRWEICEEGEQCFSPAPGSVMG